MFLFSPTFLQNWSLRKTIKAPFYCCLWGTKQDSFYWAIKSKNRVYYNCFSKGKLKITLDGFLRQLLTSLIILSNKHTKRDKNQSERAAVGGHDCRWSSLGIWSVILERNLESTPLDLRWELGNRLCKQQLDI